MSFETNHGNKVNVEILLAHFFLNINKGGLRNRLGIDLEALEGCQPSTVVFQMRIGQFHCLPHGSLPDLSRC